MTTPGGVVFIVDDDVSVRKALERLVRSAGLDAIALPSATDFLELDLPERPCCLVLDVRMPGLSGLGLQDQMRARKLELPIIFITGHGDVPMTVRAMKAGAVDFLQKPVDDGVLLDTISSALKRHAESLTASAELEDIHGHLELLTPRERQVLGYLITGMLNKQIASELRITEKTVKVHRARVLSKMGVVSIAELVRLSERAGIHPAS
ncbi:MAG: response regulator transcription factor [Verrucomicrobia bacterium]|nr:response regulator transcription factor [Verrucomicrobiota bacterium]